MSSYIYKKSDFNRAFRFAVRYHLDPAKSPVGRTSGEPRGLGSVLDAFMRGKLIEIAVQKMLKKVNSNKNYELNFNIMNVNRVKDEPDITSVVDKGVKRDPKIFVEIKSTSSGDRWIGLNENQMSTMIDNSKGREIDILYISLHSKNKKGRSHKTSDIVGMYLKELSRHTFLKGFADLNCEATLEFIVSIKELKKYGIKFPKDNLLYETDLFREVSAVRKKSGGLKAGITHIKTYKSFKSTMAVPRIGRRPDKRVGIFNIRGSFETYKKTLKHGEKRYICCLTDTEISNNIFGTFKLKRERCYEFNLLTVGRFPELKQNNLWISKNRVKELVSKGKIRGPDLALIDVANGI